MNSSKTEVKKLDVSNMNQNILKAQYAVRGAIVVQAMEYQEELKKENNKLPFDKLLFCKSLK
jgi:alanine transaminase